MRYLRGVTPLELSIVRFLGLPGVMSRGMGFPHPELRWKIRGLAALMEEKKRIGSRQEKDFILEENEIVGEETTME